MSKGDAMTLISIQPNGNSTFVHFVALAGNKGALEACKNFASLACKQVRPLLLYGTTATGKSHLLHAIANELLGSTPNQGLKLTTAEQWREGFIEAIRTERVSEFRREIENLDVLLLDEFEILRRLKHAQEELAT